MPASWSITAVVVALAGTAATGGTAFEAQRADPLDSARTAIGFRAGGPVLRSLRIDGIRKTTQSVFTDTPAGVYRSRTHERPVTLRFLSPNRFLDTFFVGPAEWRSGIDAGRPIQSHRRVQPEILAWEHSAPYEGQVDIRRLDFSLFVLGLFARTDVTHDTTVTPAGPNAVRVAGAVGTLHPLNVTLELDPSSHLPKRLVRRMRRVVHQPDSVLGRISGDGGGANPGAAAPEVEVVTTYSDHRDVSGFRLPFLITTTGNGTLLEEIRVEKIQVNSGVTDEDFR
jgi:hypothetical protein